MTEWKITKKMIINLVLGWNHLEACGSRDLYPVRPGGEAACLGIDTEWDDLVCFLIGDQEVFAGWVDHEVAGLGAEGGLVAFKGEHAR